MPAKSRIVIVAGATASGKSAHAIEIAQRENGVIINCDSMQIFNALPILAAQPSAEDIAAAPHRLYGVLEPNAPCSAGMWRRMVEPIIKEVLANDQLPIICGGTGFYIKSLMHGLSPIPETPDDIRQRGMALMEKMGCQAFYQELIMRDPLIKGRFHENHSARISRAWEVLENTGISLVEWQDKPLLHPPENWAFDVHRITPEREVLYERCNRRFDIMMDMGAMDEVIAFKQRCDAKEIGDSAMIKKALGFMPLCDYLDGKCTLDEAKEKSKQDTRRYAKRQMTWLRNQLTDQPKL